MKRTVFTKSMQLLVITLLLLALLPKGYSQKLMIVAIFLWLSVIGGSFLYRHSGRLLKLIRKVSILTRSVMETEDLTEKGEPRSPEIEISAAESPEPTSEPKQTTLAEADAEYEMMLRHIALRVTEKLKSAYPDAVWQWQAAPVLKNILYGQVSRIQVENMEKYTHADIVFDRYGRIHIEPMIVGSFTPASAQQTAPEKAAEPETSEPPVVDVNVWYELIGQTVLDTVITDLNTKGHNRLLIKENGDIVINRQKKEVVQATLESFPGPNYWSELLSVLEENELNGKITGNQLQISWN